MDEVVTLSSLCSSRSQCSVEDQQIVFNTEEAMCFLTTEFIVLNLQCFTGYRRRGTCFEWIFSVNVSCFSIAVALSLTIYVPIISVKAALDVKLRDEMGVLFKTFFYFHFRCMSFVFLFCVFGLVYASVPHACLVPTKTRRGHHIH